MKSKFCSLILLLFPFCLFSQEVLEEEKDKSNKEHVGVKLDLGISGLRNNLNDLSNDVNYNDKTAPSFNVAVFYNYDITERLYLGIEAGYSHVLHKFEFDFYTIPSYNLAKATTTIRVSYFTFPVYLGFKLDKLSVTAGMRIGLELSNRVVTESGEDFGGTYHTEIDFKDHDYGPRIGFNYAISEKIAVELLYYQGLPNLVDYDTGDFDLYFNTWQLTAGVRYSFK